MVAYQKSRETDCEYRPSMLMSPDKGEKANKTSMTVQE
ncbi:hypothetical protein SynMINOS11_02551 [Synechococcus sp. Minos11]|nr:hypothetical protein SynMINOS11_02551 [Synechococcus sp. Minos11]